jgi:hypothetical protein
MNPPKSHNGYSHQYCTSHVYLEAPISWHQYDRRESTMSNDGVAKEQLY